jgi:hypothetical protein
MEIPVYRDASLLAEGDVGGIGGYTLPEFFKLDADEPEGGSRFPVD